MKRATGVFAFALAGVVCSSAARAEVYTSTNDVRGCAVSSDGSVIAATTGGVVLVTNGKVTRVLTSIDGLPDTKASSVLVDGNSVLVGTDRGIARLQADFAIQETTLTKTPVRAIARFEGATYLGTFGEGVEKLGEGGKLVALPFADAKGPSARARVTAFASFDGKLIAATAGAGLLRLDDGKLAALALPGVTSVSALATFEDRLWVGAVEGAYSLGKSGAPRVESVSDVRAFVASKTELLAGTFGDGLLHTSKGSLVPASGIPTSAKVIQALGVASGVVASVRCLGTADGLFVAKYGENYGESAIAMPNAGLPSNDVAALARDGDRLWVGTYDRGLALLQKGTWTTIRGPDLDERINALATQTTFGKTRLWVGTTRGLVRIDGDKKQTHFGVADGLPADDVHAIATLSGGRLLVGTAKGAVLLEGLDGKTNGKTVTSFGKKQGLKIDAAWAVAEGPKGMLLVGANTGLYARGPKDKEWRRFSMLGGQLADDWVTSLVVRGDEVFVGTYAGGVSRLVFSGKDVVSTQLGGGYVNLGGLTIVGSSLYAATMDGLLVRALDADGGASAWKNLPKAALGLDVTAVIAGDAGALWIASRRGLSHVPMGPPT